MPPPRRISQLIVESARSRISPVQNRINLFKPARFGIELTDVLKLLLQPAAVVEGPVNCVAICGAAHGAGLISPDAQLPADALASRPRPLTNPRAQNRPP